MREALKKKEEEQKTLHLDDIQETTVSPAVAAMAKAAVSSAWELKQMLGNMSKLTTNATSILNCIRGTPQPDWYATHIIVEAIHHYCCRCSHCIH